MRRVDEGSASDADAPIDWRNIVLLNAASTLAHFGQVGIGFIFLPLWATHRGLDAIELGVLSSALFLGMLLGVMIAPQCKQRFSAKQIAYFSLLLASIILAVLPSLPAATWKIAALSLGISVGLRWLALEPWLYQITPQSLRGRVIGFHEMLLAATLIFAPLASLWLGVESNLSFYAGAVVVICAFFPLALSPYVKDLPTEVKSSQTDAQVQVDQPKSTAERLHLRATKLRQNWAGPMFQLGFCVALIGGVVDGAFTGLFPLFALSKSWSADETAMLLTVEAIGGILFQYPLGWLADHRGVLLASLTCLALTCAAAVMMVLTTSVSVGFFPLFILGGGLTSFLTLGLIAAARPSVRPIDMNVSRVSIAFSGGAVLGPLIAGLSASLFGANTLAILIASLSVFLVLFIVLKRKHFSSAISQ